jgi:methyltransferase
MKVLGLDTTTLYVLLVCAVALERGVELVISRRNVRRLLDRGAVEVGAADYRWMVLLHTGFLLACPLEVLVLERPWLPPLAGAMVAVLAGTMAMRYWVIASLRGRWTTRVICVPGAPPVERGPFRLLAHPNYFAVVLELAALPLIHTAWLTALVFGALNLLVLRRRIRTENEALLRFAARPARAPRPAAAEVGDRGLPAD